MPETNGTIRASRDPELRTIFAEEGSQTTTNQTIAQTMPSILAQTHSKNSQNQASKNSVNADLTIAPTAQSHSRTLVSNADPLYAAVHPKYPQATAPSIKKNCNHHNSRKPKTEF